MTIAVGREFFSLDATLWIHAVVAPIVFGLLAWRHFKRFPGSPPATTSVAMVGIVVGLDALIVALFLEHSYAMFRSVLGTWVPFSAIVVTSYLVGLATSRRTGEQGRRIDDCQGEHIR